MTLMSEKISIERTTLECAMYAIQKLQGSLGIDLVDEDGFGYIYFAIEKALKEAQV